jgi:hypothetical protein
MDDQETPNLWDAVLLDPLWSLCSAHVYSQVRFERTGACAAADSTQETHSFVPDATDHHAVWPQSMNGPTATSPILSQTQNPETLPPLTVAPGNFDGGFDHNFGNQAGKNLDFYTLSGYNQVGDLMV